MRLDREVVIKKDLRSALRRVGSEITFYHYFGMPSRDIQKSKVFFKSFSKRKLNKAFRKGIINKELFDEEKRSVLKEDNFRFNEAYYFFEKLVVEEDTG